MQKVSILVDNDYLDLFENTQFIITKQTLNLDDLSVRKMDFTSNIKIPATVYNRNVLKLSNTGGDLVKLRQFIPNINILFENLQIITNGYLTITSITPDFIEINILQDKKDILNRLAYKNLKDIQLQTMDLTRQGNVSSYMDVIDYNTATVLVTGDIGIKTSPLYLRGADAIAPSFDTHNRFINRKQREKIYFSGLDGGAVGTGSKYLSWKEVFTSPIIQHQDVKDETIATMRGTGLSTFGGEYYHYDYFYYPNAIATLHSIFAQVFDGQNSAYDSTHNGGFLITGKVLDELQDIYFTHAAPYNFYGKNIPISNVQGKGLAEWASFFLLPSAVGLIGSTPTWFVPTTSPVIPVTSNQTYTNFTSVTPVIYTHNYVGATTENNVRLQFNVEGDVLQQTDVNIPVIGEVPTDISGKFKIYIRHYDVGSTLITSSIDDIYIPVMNVGDYITVDLVYDVLFTMPPCPASAFKYGYWFNNLNVTMYQTPYGNRLLDNTFLNSTSLFPDMNQLDFVKAFCSQHLLSFDILYNQEIRDNQGNFLGYTNVVDFWRMSELVENVGSAYDWSDKVDRMTDFLVGYDELNIHPDKYTQLSTFDFKNSKDFDKIASYNVDNVTINYLPQSYFGGNFGTVETTIAGNTLTHTNGFQIPIFVNDETLGDISSVNSLVGRYYFEKLTVAGGLTPRYSKYLSIPSFDRNGNPNPNPYYAYKVTNPDFGFFKITNYDYIQLDLLGNNVSPSRYIFSISHDTFSSVKFTEGVGTMGKQLNEGKGDYYYNNITEFLKNVIFYDYQRLKCRIKLSLDEINQFSAKYPVYISGLNAYFYVEKIEGYSSKDELSTVYLIKTTINN